MYNVLLEASQISLQNQAVLDSSTDFTAKVDDQVGPSLML